MTNKQAGFTLVELIIALAIFSGSIALISLTFIGLVRTQRTVTADRATIENSRRVLEEIVREVRSSNGVDVCTIRGTNGQSLYISKSTPELYYRDGNGQLFKWVNNLPIGGCADPAFTTTTPAGEAITPGGITASVLSFNLVTNAAGIGTATDISLTLQAGTQANTAVTTAAAVRGEGAEVPEE